MKKNTDILALILFAFAAIELIIGFMANYYGWQSPLVVRFAVVCLVKGMLATIIGTVISIRSALRKYS